MGAHADDGSGGKPLVATEDFSGWLQGTLRAQRTRAGADVPCGECRGCCTSGYFIHIEPDEKEALAAIPKRLTFPSPGLPKGHVLLGYDDKGHCPMFKANRCTIYSQRPRTCRQYDCRIFPATGIAIGGDKPAIAEQSSRWEFGFTEARDNEEYAAVRSAAAFLRDHAAALPAGFVPENPTQRAIVALKVHGAFLDPAAQQAPLSAQRTDTAARKRLAAAVVEAYLRCEAEAAGAGAPVQDAGPGRGNRPRLKAGP